jgi:hypothetical protein
MNKQKLIDKAVERFSGKWPARSVDNVYMSHRPEFKGSSCYPFYVTSYKVERYVCTVAEFQQRAREMGFINGYRWGLEYDTYGEKPALPDDVLVDFNYGSKWHKAVKDEYYSLSNFNWEDEVVYFRIVDERYKPAGTSYLQAEATEPENVAQSDWYCYDTQKALRLPPVGIECAVAEPIYNSGDKVRVICHDEGCIIARYYDGDKFGSIAEFIPRELKPLDHATRKAEAEKARVVDAAIAAYDKARENKMVIESFSELYDEGYLRMPPEKN